MIKLKKESYFPLKNLFILLIFIAGLSGCNNTTIQEVRLPVLGARQVVPRSVNTKETDTLYAQIPPFQFIDQDRQRVTQQTFAGKIYVADFFFTSCPSICPKMKTQLLRVYEQFKENKQVMILSHTIDPQHDSVEVLSQYAQLMGVKSEKWHLVTGEKDSIYSVAQKYFVAPIKAGEEPGGNAVHSGAFVLVDKNRHVRGIYDGTDATQVDRLLKDIPVLLQENNSVN